MNSLVREHGLVGITPVSTWYGRAGRACNVLIALHLLSEAGHEEEEVIRLEARLAWAALLLLLVAMPVVAGVDWPMHGHDAAHTGVADEAVEPPLAKAWDFQTGHRVWSSPAVSGGIVFVGSWDKKLYALDAVTGAKRWEFLTGYEVTSSPAVSGGVVYVGSYDNKVYALDAATGEKKWELLTGYEVDSSPTVSDGTVFVGSKDEKVYALDAATGEKKWEFQAGYWVESSPAVSGGTVYVSSNDGMVYALDAATGAKRWAFPTGDVVFSSPTVSGGTVFAGSRNNKVYALDAVTGAKKWEFQTGDFVRSSPAVSGGTVYIGSWDGKVYALDAATGEKKWEFQAGDVMYSSPAVSGGVVYIGSNDRTVYALDAATGEKKWAFLTGGAVRSSPAVSDGTVFVGSDDGKVYAFRRGEAMTTPMPTLAPTSPTTACPTPTPTPMPTARPTPTPTPMPTARPTPVPKPSPTSTASGGKLRFMEFAGYQCPFSAAVNPTVERLLKEYGNRLEYRFVHFPIVSIHHYGQKAAEAAECARDQGEFEDMHKKLFSNNSALTVSDMKRYASELGLDTDWFNSCLDSGEKASVVKADMQLAAQYDITGTPVFIIGDDTDMERIAGAKPFETFKTVLERKLKKLGMISPAPVPVSVLDAVEEVTNGTLIVVGGLGAISDMEAAREVEALCAARGLTTRIALDTEVGPEEKGSHDLVLVGGPSVNSIARELGLTKWDFCGEDRLPCTTPFSRLKVYGDAFARGRRIILAAGWEAGDTRLAVRVFGAAAEHEESLKYPDVRVQEYGPTPERPGLVRITPAGTR